MKIDSLDDFARWQLEAQQVTSLLDQIEAAECEILRSMGCPTDPASIDDVLAGRKPEPWPSKTRAIDRRRARLALHALVHARSVRQYLGPTEDLENARLAAYHAVLAGAFAGDVVTVEHHAKLGAKQRRQFAEISALGVEARRAPNHREFVQQVRAYRKRHPRHGTRAIANSLLPRFGNPGDRAKALDALRKRVATVLKKK